MTPSLICGVRASEDHLPTMLADTTAPSSAAGLLSPHLFPAQTTRRRLVDFIAGELPRWRDDPERDMTVEAETKLSEHLCDWLNSARRDKPGFDCFQFRTETADEEKGGRKIDLSIKPCGDALVVEGRRYSIYEAILPVECKRLPTPKSKDRDAWEYAVVRNGSTGGMQRFKTGAHGGSHTVAAMIGYVQQHDGMHWQKTINKWISDLATQSPTDWSTDDLLQESILDSAEKVSRLTSRHNRAGKESIELHHLWVCMN